MTCSTLSMEIKDNYCSAGEYIVMYYFLSFHAQESCFYIISGKFDMSRISKHIVIAYNIVPHFQNLSTSRIIMYFGAARC